MGVIQRIFKVGEAHVNKFVDKIEKIEPMLEQAIRDQDDHLREAREKVVQVMATEKKTCRLLEIEKESYAKWTYRSRKALDSGNTDLATRAETRANEHNKNVTILQGQADNQKKAVDNLKKELYNLEEELAKLRRNKEILVARGKMAEVKQEIYAAKAFIGKKGNRAQSLIDRMIAKADQYADVADATEEMANEKNSTNLENEFVEFERKNK